MDDKVTEGFIEIWIRIRDELRPRGFYINDGDGSLEAIGTTAEKIAGVLFEVARFGRQREYLPVAGAAGLLSSAVRLLLARQEKEAIHAAVLARDLFEASLEDLPAPEKPTET